MGLLLHQLDDVAEIAVQDLADPGKDLRVDMLVPARLGKGRGGHAGGQTQVPLLHVLVDQELPQLVVANRHPQHLAHGAYTDTGHILTQKSQFVYQKSGFQIFNFLFRVDFAGGTAAGPRLPYSFGFRCLGILSQQFRPDLIVVSLHRGAIHV